MISLRSIGWARKSIRKPYDLAFQPCIVLLVKMMSSCASDLERIVIIGDNAGFFLGDRRGCASRRFLHFGRLLVRSIDRGDGRRTSHGSVARFQINQIVACAGKRTYIHKSLLCSRSGFLFQQRLKVASCISLSRVPIMDSKTSSSNYLLKICRTIVRPACKQRHTGQLHDLGDITLAWKACGWGLEAEKRVKTNRGCSLVIGRRI